VLKTPTNSAVRAVFLHITPRQKLYAKQGGWNQPPDPPGS